MWPNAQGTELIHKRAFPPTSAQRRPLPPPLTSLLGPRSQDGTQSARRSECSPVLVAHSGPLSLTFKCQFALQHGSGLQGESSRFLLATVSASRPRELPRTLPSTGAGAGAGAARMLVKPGRAPDHERVRLAQSRRPVCICDPLPPLTWVKETDGFRKAKFPQGAPPRWSAQPRKCAIAKRQGLF